MIRRRRRFHELRHEGPGTSPADRHESPKAGCHAKSYGCKAPEGRTRAQFVEIDRPLLHARLNVVPDFSMLPLFS